MSCMTKEVFETFSQEEKSSVLHFACCKSDKIAICGERLKGLPPEDDRAVDCKECERIDNLFPASACSELSTCFIKN